MKKLFVKMAVLAALSMVAAVGTVNVPVTTVHAAEAEEVTDNQEAAVKEVKIIAPMISSKYEIGKGKTVAIKATINGKESTALTYKSGDSSIVKVSSTGKMTGLKGGTTVIKVASKKNPKVYDCIRVTVKTPATKVTPPATTYIAVGQKTTLKATVSPSKASQVCRYGSVDNKIVSSTFDGKIKGLKAGETYVKIKTKDGTNLRTKANVIVVDVKSSIKTKNIHLGSTYDLSQCVTVVPANQTLVYKSSDTAIVKVTSKGVITPVKAGSTTVKVYAKNCPKAIATIKVNVYYPRATQIDFNADSSEVVIDSNVSWKSGADLYDDIDILCSLYAQSTGVEEVDIKTVDAAYKAVYKDGTVSILNGKGTDVTEAFKASTDKTYTDVTFTIQGASVADCVKNATDLTKLTGKKIASTITVGKVEISDVSTAKDASTGIYYTTMNLNGKTYKMFTVKKVAYIVGDVTADDNFLAIKNDGFVTSMTYITKLQ